MLRYLIAFLLASSVASAQQQPPSPEFVAKALSSVQAQRNLALDMQASAEAREALLKEEIEKLKAELAKLKPNEN